MRWQLLNILHKAVPYTTSEQFLFDVVSGIYPKVTKLEIRQQLDYLTDRKLIELDKQPHGVWFAEISRLGVDIVEYTIDCQAGIARPEKYWE
ncbi:hypothetical protein QJU87_05250 [Pasteurella skyensis]|nr:hypothetical protein [Pasteurella skyensis]MDP8179095.1 hypothetical protein [Pasteurella skyensis]MDP8189271.1 hypothetical protein [Pasteurella skyensis]